MTALVRQRCRLHPAREAVARCPECGRYFCRECVTEHAGRVLCAGCLARVSRPSDEKGTERSLLPAVGRTGAAAAGLLALWFMFFAFGRWLTSLPSDVHDGSVWEETVNRIRGASEEPE